jgi:hypothetical protein
VLAVHGPPAALAAVANPEAPVGAEQPTLMEALPVRDDRGDRKALATTISVKALMGTKGRFRLAARELTLTAVLAPAVEEVDITAAVAEAAEALTITRPPVQSRSYPVAAVVVAGAPPSSRIRQRTCAGRKEVDRLARAWSSSDGKRAQVKTIARPDSDSRSDRRGGERGRTKAAALCAPLSARVG